MPPAPTPQSGQLGFWLSDNRVLASKVVAVLIALRLRKLLWVANLFYLGVVCWNTFIVLILSHSIRHLAHSWM